MSKLSYLIVLILWAVLSYESLAVSDNELSSSPHIRKKRMDQGPNPKRPRYTQNIGDVEDDGYVNIEEPTRVDIITDDNKIHPGFAIHDFFIVTRPEYVQRPLRIKLTSEGHSLEYEEGYSSPIIDISTKVAVVKVIKPISFVKPELHALEKEGYTEAAIMYALGIVKDWLQYHGHTMRGLEPRWQAALSSYISPFQQERIKPIKYKPDHIAAVDLEDPTRVEVICDGHPPVPGFAIHSLYVVMHHKRELGKCFFIVTMGNWSIKAFSETRYINEHEQVVVFQLLQNISLRRPERKAFYYYGYSKAAINYAVRVVQRWMDMRGYRMIRGKSAKEAGSTSSRSETGH